MTELENHLTPKLIDGLVQDAIGDTWSGLFSINSGEPIRKELRRIPRAEE